MVFGGKPLFLRVFECFSSREVQGFFPAGAGLFPTKCSFSSREVQGFFPAGAGFPARCRTIFP